jgi:hypothetical protein
MTKNHPEIRRDNHTGTVVIRQSINLAQPWVCIWAMTVDAWGSYTDEQVATWPILNPEYLTREMEQHRRTRNILNKENGRLSRIIGELRAQLAREREKRRRAETENRDARYWADELDKLAGIVRRHYEREEQERKESTIVELKVTKEPEIDEHYPKPWDADEHRKWIDYLPKFNPAEVSAALQSMALERDEKPEPESWPIYGKACYVTPLGTPVHVTAWCKCRERRRLLWQ